MPIEWGDLPEAPSHGGRGFSRVAQLSTEATELKARPMYWGIIARKDDRKKALALASHIRNGKAASFRDGKYEAEVRGGDDEPAAVWARYVGPA